jgi:SAM-dependent methyltransferase
MRLIPQTAAWYDRLATLQVGYQYPWQSQIGDWHGEDAYLALVQQHLTPDADVLDIGCGHGEVAVEIAPRVRSVLAYDRTAAWIELGRQAARERGLTNLAFVCHDSAPEANGGQARLPAAEASFDLLICSKGPHHWIEDVRRVARPGATILMLVPDATPDAPWRVLLPTALQWWLGDDPLWPRGSIEPRLEAAGLAVESWWSFDVPELFTAPEHLCGWLTWGSVPGEVPAYAEVRPALERIFAEHAAEYRINGNHLTGVAIRRRRYLWRALLPRQTGEQTILDRMNRIDKIERPAHQQEYQASQTNATGKREPARVRG